MNNDAIWSTVESLRQIFAIVLALSLNEAFKQFIADRVEAPSGKSIRWDCLLALLVFLLLLVPFYHGMARYLYDVYHTPASRPQPYSRFLLIDVISFTVEASLFFVMSRALRRVQWRRFYWAVVVILASDAVWGATVWLTHTQAFLPWLILNLVFLAILGAVLMVCRTPDSRSGPVIALIAMAVRTILDYATSWTFYFPA